MTLPRLLGRVIAGKLNLKFSIIVIFITYSMCRSVVVAIVKWVWWLYPDFSIDSIDYVTGIGNRSHDLIEMNEHLKTHSISKKSINFY